MAELETEDFVERVSPELALIDPDLRRLLIERSAPEIASRPPDVASTGSAFTPDEAPERARRLARRHARLVLAALGGAAVTLAGVLGAASLWSHPARLKAIGSPARITTAPQASHAGPAPAKPSQFSTPAVFNPRRGRTVTRRLQTKALPSVGTRKFAWAPVAGVASYEVAFFKNDVRVYRTRTRTATVSVPVSSSRAGAFSPGTYKWYVWPVRNGRRDDVAIVRSRFVVQEVVP